MATVIDMESGTGSSAAGPAAREFRVLGAVGAWAGGVPVRVAGARQERILAALLVDAGRIVSVSALVAAVWDGEPPATAERQVRNLTTGLRRALVAAGFEAEVLEAAGHGFVLRPPALDLWVFEERVAARDFRGALAVWRGPALDGVAGTALRAAAAGLDERRLSVLELCLSADAESGRHQEAVAELAPLVAEFPMREGLVAAYMRALYRCGRQADALLAYQRARGLLSEELGVDPGPALRALHQQILREEVPGTERVPPGGGAGPASAAGTGSGSGGGESAAEPVGLSFLPYDVPDFTGRESELLQIRAAVAAGTPAVVHGMAGIGKTCLAVRAAHVLAPDFPDGQLFVDLHGFTPGRVPLAADAALEALLAQIGVSPAQLPAGADRRAALWRARSAGRRLLVLLDNAADAGQVLPLLPGSPGVAVLVTSRRQLAAVDGAASVPVEVLPDADAVALFEAVAGQADSGVVALCGHLPLAIRIAAARLQHRPQWTAEWLAGRLGMEHRRLAELRIAGRDVAAAFALSYQDLDPAQQRMFRALGQHPGGEFGPGAAAAAAGVPLAEAEDLLEALLDAHLVRAGRRPGRYGFHDLLAEHAREAAGDGGTGGTSDPATVAESEAVFDRLVAYYLAGGDAAWHEAERVNVTAMVAACHARGRDHAPPLLASAAVPYLRESGHLDDFLAVTETAVAAARRSGDRRALARALGDRALACWESGQLDEVLGLGDEQLALIRADDDTAAETMALARLGASLGMLGHSERALACLERSLALAGELGDWASFAVAALNLSNQHLVAGRLDEALATAQACYRAREAGADELGLVQPLAQLGLVLAHRGQVAEGLDNARAALGIATAAGHGYVEAFASIDLADILLLADRPEEARAHAERACVILRRLSYPLLATMAANSLGTALRALGRPAAALAQHRLALATAQRIGYRAQEARASAGIEAALAAGAGRP